MKKRRNILIIIELILFILGGILIYLLQSHLFYKNADSEIDLTFMDMDRIVSKTDEESNTDYDSYELINKAKAQMARFYIRNDEDTDYSVASMKKLKSLLSVDNVYLVDPEGRVEYYAEPSSITDIGDLDSQFFSELRGVAGTDQAISVYIDITDTDLQSDVYHYICGIPMSNGHFIIIEDDATGIVERQGESGSWGAILPRVTLGKNGFVFAVDSTGWVEAFEDENGDPIDDISELGIGLSDIKNGFRGTLILNGKSYYCGIKSYEDHSIHIICAIPSGEITANVLVVTAVPLFITFIFLSLQLLYALMLMGEHVPKGDADKNISFRGYLLRRMSVLLVLSILFTIGSSLYTQALYATYLQAHSNMEEANTLKSSLSRNEEIQKETSETYYADLENLTTLAAKFVSDNTKQITRKDLADMAKRLGAEHILLYDNNGEVILSDAYYKGLKLSSNSRDLSYEFRKLLTGTPVLSQAAINEDYLDEPYRYVGAIVTDSDDEPNGFVQLAFSPDYLSSSLSETSVATLPSTFSGRNNAFAFIVDGDDHTVLYYPDESVIGGNVEDYGITEDMMQDDYFIRTAFDGQERLLYSSFWNNDFLYTVASVNLITMESLYRGVYISAAGIVIQLLYFFILLMIAGDNEEYAKEMSDDKWAVETQNKLVESMAAERIMRLLRLSFFVFSGVIFALLLLKELIFRNNYVMMDLLNGCWNKGIHIFSITACWVNICIVYFGMSILLFILELTGKLMNSRGETIIRMLISFARYIAVIGTVFYCAKLLGAPTDTLLASAGILTVVVGLGAQSLVTDVLAGLFIIFERVFKVGDIIRMDNDTWRGRVLEIGIRNTRVMDLVDNNIRIIHNSSLNQIVNLSDLPTYCYTSIGIEYSEKLERIEEIIKSELPGIRKRIPEAVEGPLYRGVNELGDSAVILTFRTACRNEDYITVQYAVNRELKLMFDRHSITVPFPQVVINKREEDMEQTPPN